MARLTCAVAFLSGLLVGATPAGQPASPLKKLQHESPVLSLAFAPDGSVLAAGTGNGTIYLWDPITATEVRRLKGHTNAVLSVAFAPDGKALASGSQDYTLRLWDVAGGKELRTTREPQAVYSVVFSPDGRTLASGGWFYHVKLWDVAGGRLMLQVRVPDMATCLAFAPDGKAFAGGLRGGRRVRLYQAATGRELRVFEHGGNIAAVAFSADGRMLASAGEDGKVGLWDVLTGKNLRWLAGHQGPVSGVAFSPDGKFLATGGSDRKVRLWGVATGKEVRRFDGHQDGVRQVAFSPNGRLLASASADRTVVLLDLSTLVRKGRPRLLDLTPKELAALWADLADADASRAARAVWALAAARQAVPYIREKLPPAVLTRDDRQRIARLITELGHNKFATRERATAELARLGKRAEPALCAALAEPPSLEARRRVEGLLARLAKQAPTAARLRAIRAVTVLEWIGTAEARQVLEALAGGAPGAWETREARGALDRLARRAGPAP